MRKFNLFAISFLLLSLLFIPVLGGCSTQASSKLKVVTGSSLLTYIVQQVGGDKVEVTNLIPPAQHPGDFNIKPGDIQTLSGANLFILHGWPGEKYADKFVASANNPNLAVVKAGIDGNWMIPSLQMAAVEKVASILIQADSNNTSFYQNLAKGYKARISSKESEIKSRLAKSNISQISVIASIRQADFLKWAGFKIAGTYDSPDSLTPQTVKELVDKGKSARVSLIINNLQDSADAGKGIAEELGIKSINLSNFPGGYEDTGTWEKAIDKNVDLLLESLQK